MRSADRRFIEYWTDQRKGSRIGYYLIYILGWTIVGFFVLFFLSKLLTNLWETQGWSLFFIFIVVAVVSAIYITHYTWTHNENRLHKLIEENKEELN